jgi:autotransporter translocation and assembly factor TamB
MEMNGNINLKDKSYDLKIAGSHINIGKFTGVGDLGIFTGALDLSGKEFDPAEMKFIASLVVDTAGYKGYNYTNIKADLNGDKGRYNYSLKADDPSFKSELTGEFVLNDTLKGVEIKGRLALDADRVNLKKGVSLNANIEAGLNKSGKALGGFASVKDLTVNKDNNSGKLKSLDLSFQSSDTLIKGKITSDFLKADGYYEGSVDNIINVFKEGRFRGIALLDSAVSNRVPYITLMDNMDFTLEASYNPFISLLVSDTIFSFQKIFLKIMKDSTGLATTEMSVDKFNLGKSRGYNASLDLKRNPERTGVVISADSLRYGTVSLTGLGAEISSTGDSAKVSLFAGDTKNSTVYDIDLIAYKTGKLIKMTTSRKQWVINGYPWEVAPGDFLIMDSGGKDLLADLHLKKDNRTIDFYGKRSEKITFECMGLGLKMLLIPGMNSHGYDGEFSGRIDYMGGVKSEIAAQLDIDRMKMNEDILGSMKISGKYQSDTLGNIEGSLNAGMNDSSVLKLDFRYGKKPEQRSLSTEFSKLPLIIIGSLSGKYISDLEGSIGGRIDLKPVNDKPQLDGEIRVSNLGLRLIPVNARFYLPGDIVKIKENRLLFSNFTVLDSLRNRLDLDGSVDLSDVKNITADLQVTSDNLQVMNTSPSDNPEFNGSVFVNSSISLSGPMQKPSLKGSLVLAQGTVINYKYIENLAVSETEKMITFASLSEDKLPDKKNKTQINQISKTPDIEATVEINPNTLFNFEISKGYDIGVHISGGGFMTYSLLPGKVIDLTGMYEIRQGSSELKIPGWPRKDFTITPGSYVRWDGQVNDPDLRIETTSKVRGSMLIRSIRRTGRSILSLP